MDCEARGRLGGQTVCGFILVKETAFFSASDRASEVHRLQCLCLECLILSSFFFLSVQCLTCTICYVYKSVYVISLCENE